VFIAFNYQKIEVSLYHNPDVTSTEFAKKCDNSFPSSQTEANQIKRMKVDFFLLLESPPKLSK